MRPSSDVIQINEAFSSIIERGDALYVRMVFIQNIKQNLMKSDISCLIVQLCL